MSNKTSHDSEVTAHGQQVITAYALIHKNFDGVEKIFLPKRADTKKFLPGVYELPGGHIDYGEDIIKGLKREIKEEFEVDIAVGEPFACFTYTNDVKGSHSIEVIYFAAFISPIEDIKIHPEDHSEFVWISEDELKKVMTENKRGDDPEIQALKRAFELLGGGPLNFA